MRWIAVCLVVAACGGSAHYDRWNAPPRSALAGQAQSHTQVYEPTVRHRQLDAPDEAVTLAAAVSKPSPLRALGGLFSGPSPSAAPVAQLVPSTEAKPAEKLVIEAWIEIQSDDPAGAAAQVRARVEGDGGRVVSESIVGPKKAAASAALELRVPPAKANAFQDWLATLGSIESRRVLASDVSKTLFDQELALANLDITMKRLQKLAESNLGMKELLEVEKELTRVRGQIEQIKGEQRWLLDRVAFATITLTLKREAGEPEAAPTARIRPGLHLSTLSLLDPGMRQRTRFGGGATIYVRRFLTFDLDVFPSEGGDSRAVIGTVGAALYSRTLGGGRRTYGNPFLGFRAGFGYLSGERSGLLGGELGIELVRHKRLQLEFAGRAVVFFRDQGADAALQLQLGVLVPF